MSRSVAAEPKWKQVTNVQVNKRLPYKYTTLQICIYICMYACIFNTRRYSSSYGIHVKFFFSTFPNITANTVDHVLF